MAKLPYTITVPHCCSAKVIVNFGESATAEGGNFKVDKLEMETHIKKCIDEAHYYGYAMLIAFTNSQQPTANKVLKKLGFRNSIPASKEKHPDTTIKLWYINVSNAMKKLKA